MKQHGGCNKLNLVGQRFGRLVVLRAFESDARGNSRWLCQCDCGNQYIGHAYRLRRGGTQSCGCLVIETHTTHGMRNTKVYKVWDSMHQRCSNPNTRGYANYGGRGIRVCRRWRSFANFYADMGEPNGLTLDRIDNDKGYSPNNCRWATWKTQANNRRTAEQV